MLFAFASRVHGVSTFYQQDLAATRLLPFGWKPRVKQLQAINLKTKQTLAVQRLMPGTLQFPKTIPWVLHSTYNGATVVQEHHAASIAAQRQASQQVNPCLTAAYCAACGVDQGVAIGGNGNRRKPKHNGWVAAGGHAVALQSIELVDSDFHTFESQLAYASYTQG